MLGLGEEAEGREWPMVMGLTFLVVKRRGNRRSIHTFGELTIQSMDNDQLLRCFSTSLALHPPSPALLHCSPATLPGGESRNEI